MITEDYVTFEIAKLLKEKGFNEETEYVYSNNGKLLRLCHFGIKDLTNTDCNDYHTWQFPIEGVTSIISSPTLQMAMKWLREVHHIHIRLCHTTDESYKYEIYPRKGEYIGCCFWDKSFYETYEKAAEVALKYCLEKLI